MLKLLKIRSSACTYMRAFTFGLLGCAGIHSAFAANFLYYADGLQGTDRGLQGLNQVASDNGHTVTVAVSAGDFQTKIASGNYDLGVFFVQSSASSAYDSAINALGTFVAGGGRAIYCDWSRNNGYASLFGATFTSNRNQNSVTVTDATLAANIPANPFSLANPGWGTFSTGLNAATGSTVLAKFGNNDAAIVLGSEGRTVVNGFLSDTVPWGDIYSSELGVLGLAAPVGPQLDLPASPLVATATSDAGAVVTYTVTATDAADPSVDIVATPPSGSLFSVGDTIVNVTATDDAGLTATGSFVVHVNPYPIITAGNFAGFIDEVGGAVPSAVPPGPSATEHVGFINITAASTKILTGKISYKGHNYQFISRSPNENTWKATASCAGQPSLGLTIVFNSGHFDVAIVAPGGALSATAEKGPYSTTRPAPMAGKYNIVLPAAEGGAKGHGYGVFTISRIGAVRMAGKMGDTLNFGGNSTLLVDEQLPVFLLLKNGQRCTGTLLLENRATDDIHGDLVWNTSGFQVTLGASAALIGTLQGSVTLEAGAPINYTGSGVIGANGYVPLPAPPLQPGQKDTRVCGAAFAPSGAVHGQVYSINRFCGFTGIVQPKLRAAYGFGKKGEAIFPITLSQATQPE